VLEAQVYKQLAGSITSALGGVDIALYTSQHERKIITLLKQLVVDIRLDIRDIDYADNRAEMQKNTKVAIKQLALLQKTILQASEFDVFNAVDVAHYSAQIEQISVGLRDFAA
jgi:hypothetical protein